MSFADRMEKKVFFKIVRWFAFIASFIGFIAIIIGAFLFVQNFSNIFPSSEVKVEFSDVQSAVQSEEDKERAAKEAAEIEKNNNMAIYALRQAYIAADSFFRNNPDYSILSLEALKSHGLVTDENIAVSVPVGQINGLKITAKHKMGNKTYYVDAGGNINEQETSAPPTPAKIDTPSKTTDVKESKMESLINEVINEFPKDKYDHKKIKELLYTVTDEIKEDYQAQYLKDLKAVVKQAPAEKKPAYLGHFTGMFKEKLTEVLANKELKKMTAYTNFAIYAGTIFGGVLTIALFGLILVLLAIERNTRKTEV